jgi:MFS family permease
MVEGAIGHRTDASAERVVWLVFFTSFLDLVGFGIIIPLLPLYVKSMGGTAETVGVLLSCFSLTQLVATPLLGRLSDNAGRRRVILVSLAGNAASMVLFSAASYWQALPLLFVSRILAGATAGNLAACQAAVADVTRGAARARGMGRIGAGIGLGLVLGPAIGGWASTLGAAAPPLFAAALAGVDWLASFWWMPETLRPGVGGGWRSARVGGWRELRVLLGDARILAVLALSFLTFLYMTNMQVSLPLLASSRWKWGEADIGHVFALYGLVGLLTQGLLIGRLTGTFGPRAVVAGGALASCAGLTIVAFAQTTALGIVGIFLIALGIGLTNPVISTLASEYAAPSRQGTVLGVTQSAGGLARTLGPVTSGALYARVAPSAAFVGGAVSAIAAFFVALGLRHSSSESDADQGAEAAPPLDPRVPPDE